MRKTETIRLGNITIKSLKNFVDDNYSGHEVDIFLNPNNLDDIVLEYRNTYKESIILPKLIRGINIKEDWSVPPQQIRIALNGENIDFNMPTHRKGKIYLCSGCGNIVDYDGSLLPTPERGRLSKLLENFISEARVEKIRGNCCPN